MGIKQLPAPKEMLKKLELTYDMHVELIRYCKQAGIEFLSTPFNLNSIRSKRKTGDDRL